MSKAGIWGDLGNGMYRNPVLFTDYPDPDAIRVGDTYYMTSSEMNFMGMRILASKDLVNWQMIGSIYDRLPGKEYETMERYGRGSWAPSIRYHNGIFRPTLQQRKQSGLRSFAEVASEFELPVCRRKGVPPLFLSA